MGISRQRFDHPNWRALTGPVFAGLKKQKFCNVPGFYDLNGENVAVINFRRFTVATKFSAYSENQMFKKKI